MGGMLDYSDKRFDFGADTDLEADPASIKEFLFYWKAAIVRILFDISNIGCGQIVVKFFCEVELISLSISKPFDFGADRKANLKPNRPHTSRGQGGLSRKLLLLALS